VRVSWSERARLQTREIFEYVARERPLVAERLVDGFIERTSLLAEFSEQGTPWGRPHRSDLRAIVYESYRIVYRIGAEEVAILSVRHTRMKSGTTADEP
jgi:toxin ParE1/3/4